MRRMIALLAALLLSLPLCVSAQDAPEWDYPLAPEILNDPQHYITLTNRSALLDASYEPEDLETLSMRAVVKGQLRKEANAALKAMFDAAGEAGYTLYVKSAYRNYRTQKTMYYNRLDKLGRDDGLVAYPGSSDHQTGLGVDILNYDWTQKEGMNKDFGETAEAKWMYDHCQDFGFILRYMEDKEESTGIKYEPWHFRYVGPEAAEYIMEKHLSLEEFTAEYQAYLSDYAARGGDFEELLRSRARLNPVNVVDKSEDGEEEISIF